MTHPFGSDVPSPWHVTFHRQARKDAERLERAGLRDQAEALLAVLAADPFASPPPFEKLSGDLVGLYSRRIDRQHRLVYYVLVGSREVGSCACGRTTTGFEPSHEPGVNGW